MGKGRTIVFFFPPLNSKLNYQHHKTSVSEETTKKGQSAKTELRSVVGTTGAIPFDVFVAESRKRPVVCLLVYYGTTEEPAELDSYP